MKQKVLKFWGGLAPVQQIALLVILALIAWWLIQVAKARIEAQKEAIKGRAEISVLQEQGIKATYGSATYVKFADVIERSIAGAGTDENMVYKTMSYLNNDIDFIKLNNAFGIREGQDMRGWIRGDMDANEIAPINSLFSGKGMKKRI